jgi:hypothetical protein
VEHAFVRRRKSYDWHHLATPKRLRSPCISGLSREFGGEKLSCYNNSLTGLWINPEPIASADEDTARVTLPVPRIASLASFVDRYGHRTFAIDRDDLSCRFDGPMRKLALETARDCFCSVHPCSPRIDRSVTAEVNLANQLPGCKLHAAEVWRRRRTSEGTLRSVTALLFHSPPPPRAYSDRPRLTRAIWPAVANMYGASLSAESCGEEIG